MKSSVLKPVTVLLLVLFISMLLTACGAAQAAQLQQLPDEGRILVLELITAGVAAVLLWLSGVLKLELQGFVQPISAALSPLVVTFIEHYLKMIPSVYDDFMLVVIHYIVLFLGGVATVVVYRRLRDRDTKALLS